MKTTEKADESAVMRDKSAPTGVLVIWLQDMIKIGETPHYGDTSVNTLCDTINQAFYDLPYS